MKSKTKKVWLWVLSVFCIMGALVYLPSFASVILLVAGIVAMPIKAIGNLWEKVPFRKILKPTIITVLFFWGLLSAPTTETPQTDTVVSTQEYETESETDSLESAESQDTQQKPDTPKEDKPDESSSIAESTADKEESGESSESATKEEKPVVEEFPEEKIPEATFDFSSIPAYTGEAYVVINENVPFFAKEDMDVATVSYEKYASLDAMGRCGVCIASVGPDIMPTEERGEIGMVKPSGWNQEKYPGIVDGNYLYNRCHLIGYQLTGENANTKNLITGTRSLNIDGMLPFENMVADYVKETGNHVLYRVTPVFENDNPLASGVLMEGKSVEDDGEGVLYCVYCYNAQPGIIIDYTNGASKLAEGTVMESSPADNSNQTDTAKETESQPQETQKTDESTGNFAVNSKNGKIHMVGACSATGTGDSAMTSPVYFDTYEEAESYSIQIAPNQEKRKCGNCW